MGVSNFNKSFERKAQRNILDKCRKKKNENKKLLFKYKSVVHTSNPNTHLLIDFIAQDIVTMDHIIRAKKNKDSTMGRREAGPLFKIYPKNLNLLIPIVEKFNLVD